MTNTQKFIEEVEERLTKVTPGPWANYECNRGVGVTFKSPAFNRGNFYIARYPMRTEYSLVSHEEWVNNAELIANAPAYLAKAISALKEAYLTLTEQLKHVCDEGGDKPCSQMWFQDVAQESLNEIEKILEEK